MLAITKQNFTLAYKNWINLDLPIFMYIFKTVLASLLSLSTCMYFNLSMPQTSIFTVIVIMQSHSGLVFSKSFYRLIATLMGTIMSLVLVSAFIQDRISFTIFLALWIALCSVIGFMSRNFMAYGFILSGFTIVLVTMPTMYDLSNIFNSAMDRTLEVIVGLFFSSIVSEVIFPKNLFKALQNSEKNKFFLLIESLKNHSNIFDFSSVSINYSRDILGADALRTNSSFETNMKKIDKIYYKRLNSEFMHISTTFFSLRNIINNNKENENFIYSLKKIYKDFEIALENFDENQTIQYNLKHLLSQKNLIKAKIKSNIDKEKQYIDSNNFILLSDFKSITSLIQRLVNEVFEYCDTYLNFVNNNKKVKHIEKFTQNLKFSTHSDNIIISMMILRSTLTLSISMCFWMISGWQYAVFAVIPAVALTILLSNIPNPAGAVKDLCVSAVITIFITYIYNFYIIPMYVNDIISLCIFLTPALAFLALLMILPGKSSYGFGFLLIFINSCAIYTHYNMTFEVFADTSIATIIGLLISGASFIIIDFTSSNWIEKRVRITLSNQIISLINDKLSLQRIKLESSSFDLMQRYSIIGRLDNQTNTKIFRWVLSILEIGKAIINIREKLTLFVYHKPTQIHRILTIIKILFNLNNKKNKTEQIKKIEKLIYELKNTNLQHANDQKILTNIYLELSIIYSIIRNTEFLPIRREN